jgi:hypothetical protein
LTLGYRNLDVLNAEKFFIKDGVRGWRTGDLGRQLASGSFEILGRIDSLRKVRGGFRVDLLEVKSHLLAFDGVVDCHVSMSTMPGAEGIPSEQQMVAYVEFKQDKEQESRLVEDWKQVSPRHFLFDSNFAHMPKKVFDEDVQEVDNPELKVDLGFDHQGWLSSFDHSTIPVEDMAEWLDATIDRLLALGCFSGGRKPHVLEIGFGTGMILFRVAPFAGRYVGIEMAASKTKQVRAHARESKLHHVEVSLYINSHAGI